MQGLAILAQAPSSAQSRVNDVQNTIDKLREGDLSEEEAADLMASIMEAQGCVGAEYRDRLLEKAGRAFSAGDQVPGGGY
ncbi:hypothetical protein A2943_02100 [Candidatus Adlerbacteria bacterium RIFCSPLOWO2_01_FULL_51_16]|uniref:Uncharacterized protein n=1 Tax=Candidatus Adlerbacteria bacterium RIFCSPLOWO2_01_FULL_51_16 TaxID=1797243 RepID=A0A1F4XFM3_9BACT|nr:MAG: hypothetical protein A2943_02100 [Candidatus Adlerbacteria bacterium RIFCSPLOWO2_01_FULL_51_16]